MQEWINCYEPPAAAILGDLGLQSYEKDIFYDASARKEKAIGLCFYYQQSPFVQQVTESSWAHNEGIYGLTKFKKFRPGVKPVRDRTDRTVLNVDQWQWQFDGRHCMDVVDTSMKDALDGSRDQRAAVHCP